VEDGAIMPNVSGGIRERRGQNILFNPRRSMNPRDVRASG